MVSEPGSARTGVARRERHRLRVLDEIKQAALAELRERGSEGVTMRAVARAIDITPSGLYRYVDGHEALLALLASDALGDLADRIEAAQARGSPRIAAMSGNRAFLAFRSACAGALEDREIDPDLTLLGELRSTAADDLPAAADLLAATGMACLVGHLSIEIGGRIGSPLTTEERYPIFVRAVMRLLGFTTMAPSDVSSGS